MVTYINYDNRKQFKKWMLLIKNIYTMIIKIGRCE